MLLSLIVAVAENGVIGREGGLPWHLSADLQNFKKITIVHNYPYQFPDVKGFVGCKGNDIVEFFTGSFRIVSGVHHGRFFITV